ncbi:MAG: ABC transporter permease [Lachnospiraceae bacterium]|nr:ABC transporter permease [Lachnospiraceae bacterium]
MKGWKDVFTFTFTQNVKGKTFKAALYGIAALIFIIFLAINIIVAVVNDDDDKKKKEETVKNSVDIIHIINESDIQNVDFQKLTEENEIFAGIRILTEEGNPAPAERAEAFDSNSREIILQIQKYLFNSKTQQYTLFEEYDNSAVQDEEVSEEIVYRLTVYLKKDGVLDNSQDRETISRLAENLADYFDREKYGFAGISQEGMEMLDSELHVESVDIEKAGESLTETLAKIFIPMIVCLVVYMLVLLYGQSISKVIVVEKSSKLMETLLTSLQPYAIVFGKIFAMFAIAMVQIVVWTVSGILGYIVGDKIASSMFSGYENQLYVIIDIFKADSDSAFTLTAVILGILVLVIGFFMYCVMSALFSSGISKAEEVSNGYALFQMVVVVAFLAAYMIPLMGLSDALVNVMRFIPVTAAFMLPADVIIGSCGILVSAVSLGIMVAATAVMIYFTGKMYKKKIF